MGKESRQMIQKMSFGIMGYEVILGIIAWFYAMYTSRAYGPMFIGIVIGTITVYGMLIDICMASEDAVYSKDEAYAKRKITLHSILRKIAIFILMILCIKSGFINVLLVVLSLFGLKAGAFLVPFVQSRMGKKS